MDPDHSAPEDPARLVQRFKQVERRSPRNPGGLLLIACQFLQLATNGVVVSRGCTRVTFEFEGYRTHAVVTLIAVTDARGEFILALDLLHKWKPDGEHRLGYLLEKAAESYLDVHLPRWRENEGADGHLTVAVSKAPDGALVFAPSGHATVRTMSETTVLFPRP
jgi:hypothetical protein